MLTLAKLLKEEGHAEGMREVAKKLLIRGMRPAYVVTVTNLPLDIIQALREELV